MPRARLPADPSSGSGFIDRVLREYRPGNPKIDPEAQIVPDPKRSGDRIGLRYPAFGGRSMQSLKKGGRVKKTGPAKLHKGERVLTVKQAKKVTPAKLRTATRKPAPRTRRR